MNMLQLIGVLMVLGYIVLRVVEWVLCTAYDLIMMLF